MNPLSKKLDKVANTLEATGMIPEATELDEVSNTLDKQASDTLEAMFSDVDTLDSADYSDVEGAEEMIAASRYYVDEAMQELEAAEKELEAAKAKKKKWTKGIKLEKGRLTKYRQEGESMAAAAHRALKSSDPSIRGMGSFFLAFHGKKKEMEVASCGLANEACGAYEREAAVLPHTKNRPAPIFPKESPKVLDKKDHFPIPDKIHGQQALARVNQYDSVPSWYKGSLEELKAKIVKEVESKFPKMEIEEEKFEPEE